jgi:hypothetical protein
MKPQKDYEKKEEVIRVIAHTSGILAKIFLMQEE